MLRQIAKIKMFLFVSLVVSLSIGCFGESPSGTTNDKQENIPLLLKRPEQLGNAPDFTAVRVGDDEFKLSSLKGKVILLNFWSVGCGVCKMQIPILVELYKKYNSEGLEIVGVCLDREAVVKSYAERMDMDYILVLANREIISKYRGIYGIPTTFVIDRQGNIVEKHIGYASKSTFEKEIKGLLNKKEK